MELKRPKLNLRQIRGGMGAFLFTLTLSSGAKADPHPLPPVNGSEAKSENVAKPKVYRAKIFNPHEFQTLKTLAEAILKDDEMPGVREAKAHEFIDFQITYDPELQERFHSGLAWLDRHSKKLYGRKFINLKPEQRRDVVQCLEIKARHRPGEEEGRAFFELARRYTYMGFYASEDALKIAIPPAIKKPEKGKRQRMAGAGEEPAAAKAN